MPVFAYKALTDSGSKVSGSVEAESLEAAQRLILDKGLIPSSVRQTRAAAASGKPGSGARAPGFLSRFESVKAQDVILFTKQLRTMLAAGIAVVQTLEVLENQTESPKLRAAIIAIAQDIHQGTSLYKAFFKHTNVFSPLYCNMVRAGEISGTLTDVLERLIYIVEHEHKIGRASCRERV